MQVWLGTMAFFAVFFIIVGVISLIWLIVHVERGMRYSRRNAFISATVAALTIGFGLHFLLVLVGA